MTWDGNKLHEMLKYPFLLNENRFSNCLSKTHRKNPAEVTFIQMRIYKKPAYLNHFGFGGEIHKKCWNIYKTIMRNKCLPVNYMNSYGTVDLLCFKTI